VAAAARDEILSFCEELLDCGRFEDYGPNGLQVPGSESVERIVTGVSGNLDLLTAAVEAEAQMVLVHHGVLWDSGSRAISPPLAERLRVLLEGRVSLAAYHLPLDAHPEIGNNALLCEALGLQRSDPFGVVRGEPIGCVGRSPVPLAAAELLDRVEKVTGRAPLAYLEGEAEIASVGIVSGGGGDTLEEAAARGLDALLTGEPEEPSRAGARENAINFIAAGHHATETFGIRRLGELLAERFAVEHVFVDIPNPV
jgi:dinuclear metal center YbgI/SA1388 family protein